jgi:hypothetical protein
MQRKGKIARLPLALRTELNQRLAANQDGAVLLEWLNAVPGVPAMLAHDFAGEPITKQNLYEWRQGGFLEWQTQQEMFDEARDLAANSGPVSATTNHDLAEQLAAVIAGKFTSLLAGWDGTEDRAFDAKLRVLTKFNQNLAVLRRANHSAARLRMDQAPYKREEQRLVAEAAREEERSEVRRQVFEQMLARKRAADEVAAQTSAAVAEPVTLPTSGARSSAPVAASLASSAQSHNYSPPAGNPAASNQGSAQPQPIPSRAPAR